MAGRESGERKIIREKVVPRDTCGLNCVCFNARSVAGKTDELRALMFVRQLDVVAVTETWLREGQDWQLNVPGYKCFRCDRGGLKRGGGVALLAKEHIAAVQREDNIEELGIESLWVELRNKKGEITLLGVYYRPPNSPK